MRSTGCAVQYWGITLTSEVKPRCTDKKFHLFTGMLFYKNKSNSTRALIGHKTIYMSVCKHGFRSSIISYFIKEMLNSQDEIARICKRKRGRNMLNRSGNTTDNLCFRYRFRDVFSRFRCCVYNGTGPLLRKHNGNMELHVSATFPFTDSCNFVLWWFPCLHSLM